MKNEANFDAALTKVCALMNELYAEIGKLKGEANETNA